MTQKFWKIEGTWYANKDDTEYLSKEDAIASAKLKIRNGDRGDISVYELVTVVESAPAVEEMKDEGAEKRIPRKATVVEATL